MLQLDHLVVTAADLDQGAAEVEQALGVTLGPGGQHAEMGTHNRLLGLGDGAYLEVIAPDPAAAPPGHARWYALDQRRPRARLSHWAARVSDLQTVLEEVPLALGAAMDFARGAYRWQMAVPEDGLLPYNGAAPAVLAWQGAAHPAADLPDQGCRLLSVTVSHPQVEALLAAFPGLASMSKLRFERGRFEISAEIETPSGCWTLA